MIDILTVAGGCEDTEELTDEIRYLVESKSKVFRTYLETGESEYAQAFIFVTTSKDVHLAMGRLSRKGLYTLADVIYRAFEIEETYEGLLTIPGSEGTMLVIKTSSPEAVIFTLSPAR